MASRNLEELRKLDNLKKVLDKLGKPNDPTLFKMVMKHFGVTIIPLISLEDGGLARGRFVGMLRQLGVRISDTVARDKTLLSGESGKLDSKVYNAGIREGMSTRRNRVTVEIETLITRVSHQKMYTRVRDVAQLQKELIAMFKIGVKGGGNGASE